MGCVSSKNARSPSPPHDIYSRSTSARLPEPAPEKIKEEKEREIEVEVEVHDEEDNVVMEMENKAAFSFRFEKMMEAEQVAAGWPAWLTAVAGEAIEGWLPLRSNAFEKIEKIGQGTYSSVYRARELKTGRMVAVKKVRFDNFQPESVRFMAREIVILRKLDHPNIIKLDGIITSRLSCSIYLVFEYMAHDLSALLSSTDVKFTDSQIKCYTRQLLRALEHCHSRGIMHRDIKSANLLVGDDGILKMADFGLANFMRPMNMEPLTSRVITLWYRPPELLLGSTNYGEAIDLWSVGCVFGELFIGRPILKGRTEVEQLHKIFKLCGSPAEDYWRRSRLPLAPIFKPQHPYQSTLRERCKDFPRPALNLIQTFLSIDPYNRGTAASALQSEYFQAKPYACEPSNMPKYSFIEQVDVKIRDEVKRKKTSDLTKVDVGSKIPRISIIPMKVEGNIQVAQKSRGGHTNGHRRRGSIESKASLKPIDDTKSDLSLNSQVSKTHSVPMLMTTSKSFSWAAKRKNPDVFTRLHSHNNSRSQKSNSIQANRQENDDKAQPAKPNTLRQKARLHRHGSFDSCDYEPQEPTMEYITRRKGQSRLSGPLVYQSQEIVSRNYEQPHHRSRFYKD